MPHDGKNEMHDEVSLQHIQKEIKEMVFLLGLNSETQLCEVLDITQGAISKWKKRGIPAKYKNIVASLVDIRIKAAEALSTINVTPEEVAEALEIDKENWIYQYKKKNPHLYRLIEDGIRIQKMTTIAMSLKMGKKK